MAGLIDAHIAGRRDRLRASSWRWCVGLLGAAYPAYRGAQLLPTEALRHE